MSVCSRPNKNRTFNITSNPGKAPLQNKTGEDWRIVAGAGVLVIQKQLCWCPRVRDYSFEVKSLQRFVNFEAILICHEFTWDVPHHHGTFLNQIVCFNPGAINSLQFWRIPMAFTGLLAGLEGKHCYKAYTYMNSGFVFPNLSHHSGIMHLTLLHQHSA